MWKWPSNNLDVCEKYLNFPTRVPFDVEGEPYLGLKLASVTEKMKMHFFGDLVCGIKVYNNKLW